MAARRGRSGPTPEWYAGFEKQRRERNGHQYVRCHTFNRHQIKKIWYPSPRFYMVPVDCAEELGKAIIAAARGEMNGQLPG